MCFGCKPQINTIMIFDCDFSINMRKINFPIYKNCWLYDGVFLKVLIKG